MNYKNNFPIGRAVHEHDAPEDNAFLELKREIDLNGLTDMWDMILSLDFHATDVTMLSRDAREEFCGIVSLLLRAFTKADGDDFH